MLKGAIHIHSTYSDGQFTLPELRRTFLAEGCSFLCMTDHAEYFDEERLKSYFEECRALSDEQFRLVPGLEYACDRDMHILGYGASRLASSKDPQEVIAHVNKQGAISVMAHPKDEFSGWIESFHALPQGIEAWNSKYDGKRAPRPGMFALVQRLQVRKPDLRAFYGLDLHWKHQFRGLLIQVSCQKNDALQILSALSRGDYSARKGELELPSSGALPPRVLEEFERARKRSKGLQAFLRQAKGALDRCGIEVPEGVKAQLRRIF